MQKLEILLRMEMVMMMEAPKSFMLIFFVNLKTCCMLEMLLEFHSWYKRGHPFPLKTPKEKEEVMNAIHISMWQIKTYAPSG